VQLNYEKMRRMAISEDYTAVWCVESDMIVPPDALTKLMAIDAPVVSGLYVLRHGSNVPNLMRPNEPDAALEWDTLKEHVRKGENFIQIGGGCQGCVVLRREVLEQFTFIREGKGAPDMDLMRYCLQSGIRQVGRLDVRCGHIESSGAVLRPETYL
jgi:hypothetical protein